MSCHFSYRRFATVFPLNISWGYFLICKSVDDRMGLNLFFKKFILTECPSERHLPVSVLHPPAPPRWNSPEVNKVEVVFIHSIEQHAKMSTVYSLPSCLVQELRWQAVSLWLISGLGKNTTHHIFIGACDCIQFVMRIILDHGVAAYHSRYGEYFAICKSQDTTEP